LEFFVLVTGGGASGGAFGSGGAFIGSVWAYVAVVGGLDMVLSDSALGFWTNSTLFLEVVLD